MMLKKTTPSPSPPASHGEKKTKGRARKTLQILRKTYTKTPEAFVRWKNPLELTIATVLSAQCTDKKVNEVTATLFKKYKTAKDYANANLNTLEKDVHSTGFYKSKAKYLKGIGTLLVKNFGGTIPKTRDELITLPGVSYKSANLIMAKTFGIPTGIAVDTHVNRVAPRLGLTYEKNSTEKKAADLEKLFPKKDWLDVNEYFILHGRATCVGQKPKCVGCPLRTLCPSAEKYIKMYWSDATT